MEYTVRQGTPREFLQQIRLRVPKEMNMPQAQTMTLDEKLAIGCKAAELRKAGDIDGYRNQMKKLPIPPYLAKVLKEKVGAEKIKIGGWDLTEVDVEFGPDWLNA